LLRPGGPGGGPSKLGGGRSNGAATRPVPQPTPRQTSTQSKPIPHSVTTVASSHKRVDSAASQNSIRAPPPPPPASPPAVKKPTAKALYDFSGERSNELSIRTGEIIEILSKGDNGISPYLVLVEVTNGDIGWWLCKNMTTSVQGWAPTAYLEEQMAPAPRPTPPPPAPKAAPVAATNGTSTAAAVRAKPTPPAPPAKRPTAGRKPISTPARDSGVSINSQGSSGGSGRVSNASLAGGLAEALRQRQSALRGTQDDDDDW
jgi:myosin-1